MLEVIMSVIRHREIDINLVDTDTYDEYFVERGAEVYEHQIRYDNKYEGEAWVFSKQPWRLPILCPNRKVIINLYDPFKEVT